MNIDHPRKGAIIGGRYKLLSLLGRGGMGEVWFGEHEILRQPVAIKLIREDALDTEVARARFEREALLVSRLQHPHVVRISDYGYQEQIGAYHVMEYLEGRDLSEMIKAEGPLPIPLTVHIAKQIASALCGAHDRGLIHRDLKPANVFIQEDAGINAFVKVLDFGIAKSLQDETDFESITRSGAVIGSPPYMAPEQAMSGKLSPRTDLYSLGIVLFEMLSSEKPFRGGQPLEILMKHINEEPPQIQRDDIPPALRGLIFELLQKEPESRPQSASHVLDILDELEQEIPGRVTPTGFKSSRAVNTTREGDQLGAPTTVKIEKKSRFFSPQRKRAGFALSFVLLGAFLLSQMQSPDSKVPPLDTKKSSQSKTIEAAKSHSVERDKRLQPTQYESKTTQGDKPLIFKLSLDIRPKTARVMARPHGSAEPFRLLESEDGFALLPAGKYEIKVLNKNKKPHRQSLEIYKNQTLRLKLKSAENREKPVLEPTLPE